jgi:hypothetical protein
MSTQSSSVDILRDSQRESRQRAYFLGIFPGLLLVWTKAIGGDLQCVRYGVKDKKTPAKECH